MLYLEHVLCIIMVITAARGEAGRDVPVSTSDQAGYTPPPSTSPVETSGTATAASAGDGSTTPPLSRVRDLDSFFKMGPGGFSRNPETFAFVHLQKYLSNIKWVCICNMLYSSPDSTVLV